MVTGLSHHYNTKRIWLLLIINCLRKEEGAATYVNASIGQNFMSFTINDKTFEIQISSDVIRDGLGIELWDSDNNILLLELFRNDAKKQIEFHSETTDISFEAVEILINAFESKVGRIFKN